METKEENIVLSKVKISWETDSSVWHYGIKYLANKLLDAYLHYRFYIAQAAELLESLSFRAETMSIIFNSMSLISALAF